MANQRFDLRKNPDGYWTVYDVFTGQTAVVDGVELNMLEADEADDMVDLLNSKDADRGGTSRPRRGPPFE